MYFDVVNHFILIWNLCDCVNWGWTVKIFPLSDPILLPLAPTITGIIADYLQLVVQEFYLNSPQNHGDVITKWHFEGCDIDETAPTHRVSFAESIRQVTTSQYQYVSTIAHRLAAKSSLTPLEFCQNLHIPVQSPLVDLSNHHSYLELCCWYNDAGYIYFQIAPEAIAIWLNYIHDLPLDICLNRDRDLQMPQIGTASLQASSPAAMPTVEPISIAIYAHARCCSLLRLAQTEKLVTISANWQISTPNWLLSERSYLENRRTAVLTRIFEESVERQLIQTLMAVLDRIYSDSSQFDSSQKIWLSQRGSIESSGRFVRHNLPNWTKLTIDLAQSWLEFYRHCRIFGDVKRQNPHLAIARCGLTAISRRYLQVLLENYDGLKLPSQ
jgi:hypothetical protein